MTITEGLAEIKTVVKRLAEKRQFILDHLSRRADTIDPLARQGSGSSEKAVLEALQSHSDLCNCIVTIRRAIRRANEATEVTVSGHTMSIADWLVWRRESLVQQNSTNVAIQQQIRVLRSSMTKAGGSVNPKEDPKGSDMLLHINEKALATNIEELAAIETTLDGALSLANATIQIEL